METPQALAMMSHLFRNTFNASSLSNDSHEASTQRGLSYSYDLMANPELWMLKQETPQATVTGLGTTEEWFHGLPQSPNRLLHAKKARHSLRVHSHA